MSKAWEVNGQFDLKKISKFVDWCIFFWVISDYKFHNNSWSSWFATHKTPRGTALYKWRQKFRKGMMMYLCKSSNQVSDNTTVYRVEPKNTKGYHLFLESSVYFSNRLYRKWRDYMFYLNFRWIFYFLWPPVKYDLIDRLCKIHVLNTLQNVASLLLCKAYSKKQTNLRAHDGGNKSMDLILRVIEWCNLSWVFTAISWSKNHTAGLWSC